VLKQNGTRQRVYDAFWKTRLILCYGFTCRISLVFGAAQELRPIRHAFSYYLGFTGVLATFGSPEVTEAFKELCRAGAQVLEWRNFIRAKSFEVMEMGFPLERNVFKCAIWHHWWCHSGTRGLNAGHVSEARKLILTMEKIVADHDWNGFQSKDNMSVCRYSTPMGLKAGCPWSSIDFLWPTLRKVVIGLIKRALPMLYLKEIHHDWRGSGISLKGRPLLVWEGISSKARRYWAIQYVSGELCLSLLSTNPEDVTSYIKNLIESLGKVVVDGWCRLHIRRGQTLYIKPWSTLQGYGVY